MDKYIKKAEVLKTLEILKDKAQTKYLGCLPRYIIDDIKGLVQTMDSEDVVAVVHGRWTEKERIMYDSMREDDVHWFTYVCSVCDGEVMNNTKYCPNCGARMDGE